MSTPLSVLIVGAGPSGLLMACQLARYGIDFRIIDKRPERTLITNAPILHIRSLELLDQLGIMDRFLKMGQPFRAGNVHKGKKDLARFSFNQDDAFYKFALLIPQSETEKILNEYLEEHQKQVERRLELVEIKQEGKKVISTIKHVDDGQTEQIESDWLVGCDGIHSTVREKAKIDFVGEALSQTFMVADIEAETSLSKDEAHGFLGKQVMVFFPLGNQAYRLVAKLGKPKTESAATAEQPKVRITITEEDVKKVVDRSEGLFQLKSVRKASPFWISSKLVEKMRQGSCFIAGDAVHVHSPVGGQGMNIGLQDSYNLAWKLALVVQGKAHESLLDSYQAEREPVDEAIVRTTEKLTKIMAIEHDFFTALRAYFIKFTIGSSRKLQKMLGRLVAQLSISYKKSPIIDYQTHLPAQAPKPGQRAPDVPMDKEDHLYNYLRNGQHSLLLFTGTHPTARELEQLKDIQQHITQRYPGLIVPLLVSRHTENVDFKEKIHDTNGVVHQGYHVSKPSLCLIRPDQYIGFFSHELNLTALKHLLERYLK